MTANGLMDSRVVVLGSCGAWPEPGRACSGFVVELAGQRIVIDLGYGTLPRLLELLGSTAAHGLDAIAITHAHPDHMVDLHGLFRARWFGARDAPPIPLYAPAQVMDRLRRIDDDDDDTIRQVFDWKPLPGGPYDIGSVRLESCPLPHFVPSVGLRLTAPELVVAYTGDTGPAIELADLGCDADLYIVEATDRSQQPGTPPPAPGQKFHLNARDAGHAATAAGARRLLLTHFWPGNDREATRREAAEVFEGEVLIATEGQEIAIPSSS